MANKLLRTRIQNFKIFTHFEVDFEGADLVLFDGPNGFGKTTFYDAIELLITGTIKRFERLSRLLVDNRVRYNENPYLNYGSTGDIDIRVAVQTDNDFLFFSRRAISANLPKTADFTAFKLYKLDSFDDTSGELLVDEQTYLKGIFGENYRENFPFLNYVEQEDHTHLLKDTESEKRQHISHLFNVRDFEQTITQHEAVKKQIGELCKPDVKRALKEHAAKIEGLKKSLKTADVIQFQRILGEQAPVWDQEDIFFSESLYSSWLAESGELTLLRKLIGGRQEYLNYLADDRLDRIIASPGLPVFLQYYHFIEEIEHFKGQELLHKQLTGLIEAFEDLTTDGIDEEKTDLSPETIAALTSLNEAAVVNYERTLKLLRDQRKHSTTFEKSLTDLQTSRNRLVEKFIDHEVHLDQKDTTCPLCGQDWQEYDELLDAIRRQAVILQELVNASSSALITAYEAFKIETIPALKEQIEYYLSHNPIDSEFIAALVELKVENLAHQFAVFEELGVVIDPYLNKSPVKDTQLQTEELIAALEQLKRGYDAKTGRPLLNDLYQKYFRDHQDIFMSISVAQVENKIRYVEWRYGIYHNALIREEETAYAKDKAVYDEAETLSGKLKEIIDVYKKSLKEYNQALIRDIEILFHIYSGRIVQDFQGGLGLFIKEERGIKFVTDPEKTYDAVFSMSAGQLAALIISFTLALNKKYSLNDILFIDDPVQTMDELNIASFIEVLRNDFGDRQIFISTHEDMMSTFIRYKFKKQGLKTKRVNMKNLRH